MSRVRGRICGRLVRLACVALVALLLPLPGQTRATAAPAVSAQLRIPSKLSVGAEYRLLVKVRGFEADGQTAVIEAKAPGRVWQPIAAGELGRIGGYVPTPIPVGIGPEPGHQQNVILRARVLRPGLPDVVSPERTTKVTRSRTSTKPKTPSTTGRSDSGQQLPAGFGVSGPLTAASLPYSYRSGCPVPPSRLREVSIPYWDFAGVERIGRMVVRSDAVSDVVAVFAAAHRARFPIRSIIPIDEFYAGGRRSPEEADIASMAADNTSAFNCRGVIGAASRLSNHANGIALDINPVENPYVHGATFHPSSGRPFLSRSRCSGAMLCSGDPVVTAMAGRGWKWGRYMSKPDYQHFSMDGR